MTHPLVSFETVRGYLVSRYEVQIRGMGKSPADVPDNFDLLLEGIIDSLGVLEMIGGMEKEFGLTLDMAGLDAEEMTILGPLSRFVAAQGSAAPENSVTAGTASL